jgi:hypothetical protein
MVRNGCCVLVMTNYGHQNKIHHLWELLLVLLLLLHLHVLTVLPITCNSLCAHSFSHISFLSSADYIWHWCYSSIFSFCSIWFCAIMRERYLSMPSSLSSFLSFLPDRFVNGLETGYRIKTLLVLWNLTLRFYLLSALCYLNNFWMLVVDLFFWMIVSY